MQIAISGLHNEVVVCYHDRWLFVCPWLVQELVNCYGFEFH